MIFFKFLPHFIFFKKIIIYLFFDFLKIALNQEKSVPEYGAIRFEFGWKIKKL